MLLRVTKSRRYVIENSRRQINAFLTANDCEVTRARKSIDLVRLAAATIELRKNNECASGIAIPMYRDLRIGLPLVSRLKQRWTAARPDLIHVATEGPLGWAAIRAARSISVPVTSDFRTNFDQYSEHYGLGWLRGVVGGYLKHFHNATDRTFVPTPAVGKALTRKAVRNEVWGG